MHSFPFLCSFFVILLMTVIGGLAARRRVKAASDFSNAGGSLSTGMVAGTLVGGFVGGTSIVGTGELAYTYGLASLWFTLGGGGTIILLGVCAAPFRRMQVETLPELIGKQYGEQAQLGSSIFLSLGMFIQVMAQLLAALPFVSVFWQVDLYLVALVPSLLIVAYVWAGGFMGASVVGTMKTAMLILLLFGTGAWLWSGSDAEMYVHWWQEGKLALTNQEAGLGWTQGLAMLVGIVSTQSYLQPIFAGRGVRQARNGAVAAGITIIVIGLVSAWIGMYMAEAYPHLAAREAVPYFFLSQMPPWVAGSAYAIILLSIVMTGAALTLSISTIFNRDVIQRYSRRFGSEKRSLVLARTLIIAVIAIAYGMVCMDDQGLILHWTFLAMTLRGVTIFFPILFYLLEWGPVAPKWATMAIWGAPLFSLVWSWWLFPLTGIDPLLVSSIWSVAALLIGWRHLKKRRENELRWQQSDT